MLSVARGLAARTGRLTACSGDRCVLGPAGRCQRAAALRTSAPRPAPLPPAVWLVLRPITKLAAVLFGRAYRKWWQALPKNKRAVFMASVRRNRRKIAAASALVGGLSLNYYYSHLQTTPVTGRTRFVAFTPEQIVKISQEGFEMMIEEHAMDTLPPDHGFYRTVVRVANRLLSANRDLAEMQRDWAVTVVADDAHVNAYAMECGNIVVFTGMLLMCDNDDQLGCVLGHEMAHTVLGHSGERLSKAHLLDLLMILPLAAIWAFLPNDGISVFAHWFFRQMVTLLGDLPHSRALETEADEVGLHLAARACFDVREASAFWAKMSMKKELAGEADVLDWLSTHPADASRREGIDQRIPELERVRALCRCHPMPERDPRAVVEEFRRMLLEQAAARRPHPKSVPLELPRAGSGG
ncbi:metalloendopeptidase OMA1, mitochondrial-like [Amphibalanus amphitrite]|uniref:metalloendopeptidase OMA1, mitochondrial-like n=1 Tax=Amphibalanus amphitrite TaxID=1232801 RepID=UPI001C91714E|nr:metalloendopeptidase OMA1, mitochondrial-like [Amphibalanus amphitrite]